MCLLGISNQIGKVDNGKNMYYSNIIYLLLKRKEINYVYKSINIQAWNTGATGNAYCELKPASYRLSSLVVSKYTVTNGHTRMIHWNNDGGTKTSDIILYA